MVYIEPIATTEGNYLHGLKVVPTSFGLRRFIVVEHDVKVLVCLTTRIPSHNIVTTKSIPLDLGGDPSKPLGGSVVTFAICSTLFFFFSRDLLNYLEYKKNSDMDVHVGVFKAIIKVNDEPIHEEITKIFNFMLKKQCIKLVQ